ncbi:MAG: S8 family serine peptidase [Kiritimatiellia bacterium]
MNVTTSQAGAEKSVQDTTDSETAESAKLSVASAGLNSGASTETMHKGERSGREAEDAGPEVRLGPSEVRGRIFPSADPEALAEKLPMDQRLVLQRILEDFPETDLTEIQATHALLQEKRRQFPLDLNDEEREAYAQWVRDVEALSQQLIRLHAEELGLSAGGMEAGRGYYLEGFENGVPRYVWTMNVGAAVTTGVNLVRWNPGFDPAVESTLSGDGLYVSINDHGEIYEHSEFQLPSGGGSRVVVKETPWYDNANRNHMTHVAGTVSAWGYNSNVEGMTPRTWIRALIQQTTSHVQTYSMAWPGQLHSAINPATGESEIKSVIGNTSLGAEPNTRYTSSSASFDSVMRDYPYYVHFYASANSGSNFETLGGNHPPAKNIIAIGNITAITRDSEGNYVSGGTISGSSSRGPAFDGRIKPDFVAKGSSVLSTTGDTTGTSTYSGTSMASPNAAGSAALLIDYVRLRMPGHYFRSSTHKALLMNTATDRGNPGPDYTFGWGAVNVYAAGKLIRQHAENPYSRVLREERLNPGQTWSYTYTGDGATPIRASLAWLDVAGASQSTTSTDRSPRLMNDLDMRILGPDDKVYQPYVMPFTAGQGDTPAFDSSLYTSHATTGDNFTDPAEQIWIPAPAAGTYTIQITHKGGLHNNTPQPFSLAVIGLMSETAQPAAIASVLPAEGNNTDNFAMAVAGSGFVPGSDVRLRREGSSAVQAYRVVPVGERIDFRVDTAGIDKGYYDVVVSAPDGTESVLPNGFLMPATGGSSGPMTLYSNTFQNADGLVLTGNWEVGTPNQSAVSGPGAAHTGTQALGTHLNGNYENNLTVFATLPPFSTINRTNIKLEFRRWLGLAFQQTGAPGNRHRDDARIHYSLDGSTWTTTPLWQSNGAYNESSWGLQTINLPTAVNNQAQVYIRFQLQTDASNVSYGWNIDDLKITGESPSGVTLIPPVFTSEPVSVATVGQAYSYSVSTSDEDTPSTDLVLTSGALPSGLSFTDNGDGTGLLAGTPSEAGTYEITLSVTDGDYITWQIYDLTIFPESGNSPPILLTESLPEATEFEPYTATILAGDADGDPLSFSAGALPAWIAFTDHGDGTATLGGTPTAADIHAITIHVSDGFDSDEKTYELIVNTRPQVARYAFTHNVEGFSPAFSLADLNSGPAANAGGLNRFRTDESGAVDTLSVINNSSRTDVQQAYDNQEYFSITLEPAEGQVLNLQSLDFKVTRGGTGGTRNFAVRSSLNLSTNLLGPKQPVAVRGDWDLERIDLSGPGFQELTGPVTFVFIVATDSTSISLEFDDITFLGTLSEAPDKETPVIKETPVAAEIYEGQSLAEATLSGGTAENSLGEPVAGDFAFVDPGFIPPEGTAAYAVRFTPVDTAGYYTVDLTVSVTVLPAPIYTLTFDSNEGSAVDPITQEFGTVVTPPDDPVRVGHSFMGWDPSVPETMPAEDLLLTAQWLINTYSVLFQDYDGREIIIDSVTHGSSAIPPPDPTRAGYTFTGWDVPFDNVTSNLTVTAVYSLNPPVIETQPEEQTVLYGQSVLLTVEAGGEGTLSYQWRKNDEDLPEANANSLSISFVRLEDAGAYQVVVSNEGGDTPSDTVQFAVNPAPLTVTAHAREKTEGQADPGLSWSLTDGQLFEEDEISGALTREEGEASGIYAILQGTLNALVQYELSFVGADFSIFTIYGFMDSNGDGVDDEWMAEHSEHFPEDATADTVIEQGGVLMSIREIFIAGLTPGTEERFEITHLNDAGIPQFIERTGRQYRILWTADLLLPTEEWTVYKDFDEACPETAPLSPHIFYRIEVRLSLEP